ncbi:hypothetical protein ACFXQA_11415 [Microbacterium sp. P07]|uniref:hypothetical protein n=1 Tax=Microbacterium sp. P07 TaxID=3366952 RepID=UPI003747645E
MTDPNQPPHVPQDQRPPAPQQYAPQPPAHQQPGYPQQPYGAQPQLAYGAPQPSQAPPKRNIVGLIALIVAIIGTIFACVPGALVVGWVLLPVAFILSLVSLFMKGRKGLGVTALIVSIVGTIIGFIVFFAVVGTAFSDAFGGTESTVSQPTVEPDPAAEAQPEADTAAEIGTRDNPAALGSTINGDEWTVVVNSFTPDANQAVAEANQFNEAPPAGSHYSTVNYTVTYTGADSDYALSVGISLVTSTGEVLNSYESMASLSDSMGIDELYTGGVATGSTAFTVPDGSEVLIRVRPGVIADEVFVKP